MTPLYFICLRRVIAGFLVVELHSVVIQKAPEFTGGAGDTHLILEKQEGERRIHRSAGTTTGNAPFILKVDPQNGGSKHLTMFTEDLPPGAAIPRHKHSGSGEILILQSGRSRVHLGDTVKEVEAGATVFIPEDTWTSVEVVGSDPVSLIAIFSEPGFEEYMRVISVHEGEPNIPMSKAELDAVRSQHSHAVSYK
jgi:quercetin dioxygenase-like cupin family protein